MNFRHAARDRRRGESRRAEVRRRRQLQPALLALEERKLLSTIVVNNPTDTAVPGQIDLRQAIDLANTNGGDETITFDSEVFQKAQTIKLTGGQLELSDTTGTETITGPTSDLTISGDNASRVFQVDKGVTARILGLTVSGGAAPQVPGMMVQPGGGILNQGTMDLVDVVVSDNVDGYLGAGNAFGGGLANEGSATLVGCTVSGNSAGDGGGLFNNGTIALDHCNISGNASFWGHTNSGGIFNAGTATLDDSNVSGNNGTGIYCTQFFGPATSAEPPGTLTLNHCSVDNNTGYGFRVYLSKGQEKLVDCSLSGNAIAGVWNESSSLSMSHCTVQGNGFAYPYYGAGVANQGPATITDCTITGNTGDGLFNGGFGAPVKATVTDCKINDNSAPSYGGGVFNEFGAFLTLRGCQIDGNVAGTTGGGVSNGGQLSVSGCQISGNSAGTYGGGIAVFAGSLTIQDSSVTNNVSGDQGGGLFVNSKYSAKATMDRVMVSDNSAATGGGIFNSGTLTATEVSLLNNSATDGGGIDNTGTMILSSVEIDHNAAVHDGGGLLNKGTATLTDCHLAANSAGADGGGLFNDGIAALTDCTVTGSSAAIGGGIYEAPDGTLTLVRTRVESDRGGDIVNG